MFIKKSFVPLATVLLIYAGGILLLDQSSNDWSMPAAVLVPIAVGAQILAFLFLPKKSLSKSSRVLMIVSLLAWLPIQFTISMDSGGCCGASAASSSENSLMSLGILIPVIGVGQYLLFGRTVKK